MESSILDGVFVWLSALVILLIWVPSGVAGYLMLDRFEKGVSGALLGFFLGPIGLLIAWVMRSNALLDREERRLQELAPSPEATSASRKFSKLWPR